MLPTSMGLHQHFQPPCSHGTRKPATKILQQCTFCRSDKKKIGVVLICSRRMAIVMLAVVAFSPSKSKGEEVGPLTGQSGSTRFESPCCALAESGWSTRSPPSASRPPAQPEADSVPLGGVRDCLWEVIPGKFGKIGILK